MNNANPYLYSIVSAAIFLVGCMTGCEIQNQGRLAPKSFAQVNKEYAANELKKAEAKLKELE